MIEKAKKILSDGIYKRNTIFVLLVGMCPVLAVTTSLFNGIGMGVAVIFILTVSNMVVSSIRKVIPSAIRMPTYIGVIAAFVTIVEMTMHAYIPDLFLSLGIYLPLIVVNSCIFERAESFARKNSVLYAGLDGFAVGVGFTIALIVIGFFRELLGAGTLFGIPVMPEAYTPALVMILPPGAFITVGLILGLMAYIKKRRKRSRGEA